MKQPSALFHTSRRGSAFGLLLFFIILILLMFILDMGYIFGSQMCMDKDPFDCALDMLTSDEEEEKAPEGSVTATGVISGAYKGEERSITITLSIPLEGGDVSGSFSGDCDGTIKGSFAGGNGGAISGKAKGSCAFVLPASGEFSGTVNTTSKSVPVSGKGSAAGFSGEGSVTLRY